MSEQAEVYFLQVLESMSKVKVFGHSASSSVVQGTQRIILPQIFVEFHLGYNMLLEKLGLTLGVSSLVSAIISEENQKKARQLLKKTLGQARCKCQWLFGRGS